MEETINNPTQFNSANPNQALYTKIACLNKKRKFPAEHLGIPLPKHKCSSSYAIECSTSSNANPEELTPNLFKERSACASQPISLHDSNSFTEHVDSIMSISGDSKNDMWYSKASSFDQPSTSSVNWGSNCHEKNVYSLESRSVTKPSSDIYEDPLLDLGSHEDYTCAEYEIEAMEPYIDKEFEDLLCSKVVTPDNFVLSSGRWTVNQDAEQGAEKLTIDKEFEQYFSSLML